MLSNSAGFACRHARFADRVEQRSFAVIDVPHERDNRSARLEFFFFGNDWRRGRDHRLLDLVHAGTFFAALFFENETVVLGDFRCDIGLNRLIDIGENVEIHQLGDELVWF